MLAEQAARRRQGAGQLGGCLHQQVSGGTVRGDNARHLLATQDHFRRQARRGQVHQELSSWANGALHAALGVMVGDVHASHSEHE